MGRALSNLRRGIWASKRGGGGPPPVAFFKALAVGDNTWYRFDDSITTPIAIVKPFSAALAVAYSGPDARFVVGSYVDGKTAFSDDFGVTWTGITDRPHPHYCMGYFPELGKFISCGVGVASQSLDGVTWTSIPGFPGTVTPNGIVYSPTLNRLLACGGGVGAYSDDGGVTWNTVTLLATNAIKGHWSEFHQLFIWAGRGGFAIQTSPTGLTGTWTARVANGAYSLNGVAECLENNMLVACSQSGNGLKSTDGINWTISSIPTGPSLGIMWANDRDTFFAGAYGSGVYRGDKNDAWNGIVGTTGVFYGIASSDQTFNPTAGV